MMTIPLTTHATLHPLVLPARADAADGGEFRELSRVRNLVFRELTDRTEQDLTPEELLPLLRSREERTTAVWAVRDGDDMVGRAVIDIPHERDSRVAVATIELRPSAWGAGIGSAVLPHIERVAREHGRTQLQSWVEQQAGDGPSISAPTGFGSVPDDHVSRFLLHRGFTLEQVYRVSRLALDEHSDRRALALMDEAAIAAAGYRVLQWTSPTPAEHLDGYAWMKSRMSTDAPSAGLDADEESWDAGRIIRGEERLSEMGHRIAVTVAQHIETGALAAFTELGIGPDPERSTMQHDTLVLAEHRGHRLGQLVKCAALRAWRRTVPSSAEIITYNAEENRHMLSINEAMGFVPISYEGVWKKDLT